MQDAMRPWLQKHMLNLLQCLSLFDLEVDSLDIWKFPKIKNIHANFATNFFAQPRNFIITRKDCMILKITGAKYAKNCLKARNMSKGIYLKFI